MPKIVRCEHCGDGKAHHLNEPECWGPHCLGRSEADRCTDWAPVEVAKGAKPKVDRQVVAVGARHPSTSQEAARKALPRSGTLRWQMYTAVQRAGEAGLTDDELERVLARSHQSVSACRNTLMKDGLLEDSGRKRRTQWGNMAIAWRVAKDV